ncbi:MAG: TRAP transporter large permease subunit, partial [Desulfofustis sp.]|nr:TRAP transporter large permease subunit [Desulfofustis sp.]
ILVVCYIIYILAISVIDRRLAPAMPIDADLTRRQNLGRALFAIVPPLTLIVMVLGSIFGGIATPTESAAVGCVGAIILAALYRKLSWQVVEDSALETVKITAMVFAILIGATAFSMVFVYSGADYLVEDVLTNLPGQKWTFLFLSMLAIMALGFFIDFIEISYIVVPILLPIADIVGLNPLWFAILIAMNLQTSFLTPPFGFSLFYLKGVCPPEIHTVDLYRGVIPFIVIQVLVLCSIVIFPGFYGFH